MNEEQNPSPEKGRVLGRQLPGILQGGGPVMIFGARPLSKKKSIEMSTTVEDSANALSDRSSGQTADIGEKYNLTSDRDVMR